MKIRLLKNPGYGGLGNVTFPVELDAVENSEGGFDVLGIAFTSAGATVGAFDDEFQYYIPRRYAEVAE